MTPDFSSLILGALRVLPEAMERLDDALFSSVAQAVVDSLKAEDLDEFEKLLAEGDEEKLRVFIEERAPEARAKAQVRIREAKETASALFNI